MFKRWHWYLKQWVDVLIIYLQLEIFGIVTNAVKHSTRAGGNVSTMMNKYRKLAFFMLRLNTCISPHFMESWWDLK